MGPYLDQRQALGFSVLHVNLLPWRWELVDAADIQLLGVEDGQWQARWLDPRTGEETPPGPVSVPDDGVWPVTLPTSDDWVLVLDPRCLLFAGTRWPASLPDPRRLALVG